MRNHEVAAESKGVTVKLLGTLDLGPELEGMDGRQLRMRLVAMEPGAVFGPVHDHKGRPGIVYILQGTITDHRDGVATDYGPGLGWPEDRNTMHWLENRGTVPAVVANGPTPWMGLAERVAQYLDEIWQGVLALVLWREHREA